MECPACKQQTFRVRAVLPAISVTTCCSCGLMLSHIQKKVDAPREFEGINEEDYHLSVGLVRALQAEKIIDSVRERATRGGSWLDVGCSFGVLLERAQRAGYSVLGIEPDAHAFEQAKVRLGEGHVRHGLMSDAVCDDDSRDIISLLDVLEHIEPGEQGAFLSMLGRKLRSNGLLVVKVPSSDGLFFKVAHWVARLIQPLGRGAIERLWQSNYEFPHLVYFNRTSLQLLLQSAGFHIVEARALEEVPLGTIFKRLSMDGTIPGWQKPLLAPVFVLINLTEKVRRKTDALLVIASKRRAAQ